MGIRKAQVSRNFQLSFSAKGLKRPSDRFGGSLLKGHPKNKRPLDTRFPVHLVLRARESRLRLPNTYEKVNGLVTRTAKKYGVRVYDYANVGNHIHLLLRVKNRSAWRSFIRELTGRIAQLAKGSRPGSFWLYRPFTRIIRSWKRAFLAARNYVEFNRLEAEGHIRRSQFASYKQLQLMFSDSA